MAEATFSLAAENLGDLLIQKADILRDIGRDVKTLKDELQRSKHFMRIVVESQARDRTMDDWISQLREVAQDAEDVVLTFIYKVEVTRGLREIPSSAFHTKVEVIRGSRGLLEILPSPSHTKVEVTMLGERLPSPFRSIADTREEIELLQRRLREITQIRGRHNSESASIFRWLGMRLGSVTLGEIGGGRSDGVIEGFGDSRPTDIVESPSIVSPWQNDKHVVGLEEDVVLLLRQSILDERRGLSVAGIVGIGGIGKTTLARKLFNHAEVVSQFGQCRAWVMISRVFSPNEIVKQLLLQLLGQPGGDQATLLRTMEGMQLPSLQELLHQRLRGTPFFIVLDDVWEDTHWKTLAAVLPDEGNASRLMIISRNRDATSDAHYIHTMRTLLPIQSRKLFLRTVFSRDDIICPEHLENKGRQILRKCHDIPSAIKEVGRELVGKEHKSQWEAVLNSMDLSVMSETFESSYRELPPNVKLCFLCLCFFKENAIIRVEKLVHILIAGGMILQRDQMNELMEDVARNYLDKLISRYMVQVEDITKDHQVKSCRIYDILYKLSITKAREEISYDILNEERSSQPIYKPRHCSIYCSRESSTHSLKDNCLRSLFFHGGDNFNDGLSYWKNYQLLRILDFEGFGLQEFPDAVCALTGLNYLGLRNNYIRELPDSLGYLEDLKVLDVALNFGLIVPDVIWKMKSLRHLYMSNIICRGPLRIDTLKNLHSWTYIPADNWTYTRSSLQMMTSLRKLGIELNEDSNVSNLFYSLAHLNNLSCLNLRWSRFERIPSLNEIVYLHGLTQLKLDGCLTGLPNANNFPPNLCYLTLVNTSLDEDPMPVLEELPMLIHLKLRNAYTGDVMVIKDKGFRKLQVLCIGELTHLRNMEVEEGAMPVLKRFEINNCPYLENLPERTRNID